MIRCFSVLSFLAMSNNANSSQVDQLKTELNVLMSDFNDRSINMVNVTKVPDGFKYIPGPMPEFPFGSTEL